MEEVLWNLAPAEYVDSTHPAIVDQARQLSGEGGSQIDKARRLFGFVRDLYYGAPDFDRLDSFRASFVLEQGGGYCVQKAGVFVALGRAMGFPCRLAFADVTNRLASERTLQLMQGPMFAWHGYAQILLSGRWIKVSPTFDRPMCDRLGVPTLAFDGVHDAHLQPFDGQGRTFMRYERDHGTFQLPRRRDATALPGRIPCDPGRDRMTPDAAPRFTSGILERPDASLVFDEVGHRPSALLLHAGGERRRVWHKVMVPLDARGMATIAYDQRGHGESGGSRDAPLPLFGADTAAMIGALDKPLVVGSSLGGFAALSALADPEVQSEPPPWCSSMCFPIPNRPSSAPSCNWTGPA